MFSKLKQLVGMVGIEVVVDVPDSLPSNDLTIEGVVYVRASQDQHITKITATMEQVHQEYQTHSNHGRGTSRNYHVIGMVDVVDQPFDIKAGETREFSFSLPFTVHKDFDQLLSEEEGLLGALGKFSVMLDGDEDRFWVKAVVDVKGAVIDPNTSREVRLVEFKHNEEKRKRS
jgi:hypothetical protein